MTGGAAPIRREGRPTLYSRGRWREFGTAVAVILLALLPLSFAAAMPTRGAATPSLVGGGAFTLTVTGDAPGAIGISWPEASDLLFDHYEVRDATSASGPWSALGSTTEINATSFYWDGLAPGTEYWWQVDEVDGIGLSNNSSALAFTQPSADALSARLEGPATVNLSWTDASNYSGPVVFDGALVQGAPVGEALANLTEITNVTARSTWIGDLPSNASYQFQVLSLSGCQGAPDCGSFVAPSETPSNAASSDLPGTLTATAGAAPDRLVVHNATTLSCNATGGVAPYTYHWSFGDGNASGGRTVRHTYDSAGAYAATCAVTDFLLSSASATVPVRVDPAPSGGGNGTVGNGSGGNGTGGNGSSGNQSGAGNGTGSGGGSPGGGTGAGTPGGTGPGYPGAAPGQIGGNPVDLPIAIVLVVLLVAIVAWLALLSARAPTTSGELAAGGPLPPGPPRRPPSLGAPSPRPPVGPPPRGPPPPPPPSAAAPGRPSAAPVPPPAASPAPRSRGGPEGRAVDLDELIDELAIRTRRPPPP